MKKILILISLFTIFKQNSNAQISDERDAWGNLYTPIVAIQPIINQNEKVSSEIIQKLQNSCFSGLSFAKNIHFIDRSINNSYYTSMTMNKATPQYLLKITLHDFDYLKASEAAMGFNDAYAFITFSLISVETSAILKQIPVMIYASDNVEFGKNSYNTDKEKMEIAIYGETINAAKKLSSNLFINVFEVKDIVQADDDWAEWVALENKHLDALNFGDELNAIAVKKEYTREGSTYRWTKEIGKMKQGSFEGKKDKRFFEITLNTDQKTMKKAFKDKNKVFGIK